MAYAHMSCLTGILLSAYKHTFLLVDFYSVLIQKNPILSCAFTPKFLFQMCMQIDSFYCKIIVPVKTLLLLNITSQS